MEHSAYNQNERDLHAQYAGYEQYPSSYENSSMYVTKSPTLTGPEKCSKPSYRLNPCSGIDPYDQLSSSQDLNLSNIEDNVPTHTVKYMQASHYDDIPEYELTTASSNIIESQFIEDPTITYGYVSDENFGMQSGNRAMCSQRPILFEDNLNGADSKLPTDTINRSFDSHLYIPNKMEKLSLDPLESGTNLGEGKEMLEVSGSDVCSVMQWRDPNLSEVIGFLNNPNNRIKANAAAYLQHLCYMDDPNKQRTRSLGGIPALIRLLSINDPAVYKNASGALRNLSYGRQNDENKRAIRDAGGIKALMNLLCSSEDSELRELVTGVLWNMSSCEDIKRSIIDDSLNSIVINVIKPHSGWDHICPGDTCYSTVFRNASGVLRNISSAGEYARSTLRDCEHLIECLLYVIRMAIEKSNIGNKTIENCVCILRNLSYRCQEVEDPNYDKQPMAAQSRGTTSSKGENLGCFGTNKKRKDSNQSEQQEESSTCYKHSAINSRSFKNLQHLWQPEVVQYYLALLQSCSNPETLEAAAGAIQNLSACFWQPSIDIRATVRKEKGLPILVELLRMEVDRVVCAVATALRNLAIDQRNKELIGKYAMRDLVQKLPSGNPQYDSSTSDDTIGAVLATINEVIKKNLEFSRSLLDAGGVERLLNITRQWQKYSSSVLKFSSQVLFTMWQHQELRDVYKKNGWKEHDFITKFINSINTSYSSPNNSNNTLNRPMASQGRTRYEDRTLQRVQNNSMKNNTGEGMSIHNGSTTFHKMMP